jgi:hypothetical protein
MSPIEIKAVPHARGTGKTIPLLRLREQKDQTMLRAKFLSLANTVQKHCSIRRGSMHFNHLGQH